METTLKRLWSRKKSWGPADQPANPRKLSSSNGNRLQSPSTASTTKDGRPSMTSVRQLDRSFSQDRMDRSQYSAETNAEDYNRSRSSHRIQPMLVGISRPGTANRPDTAGSFQSAVLKAADSVNRRPSDVSTTQPMLSKSPASVRSVSRHVDIFSVAAAAPSSLSRYNEEIAERNIDTLRLALENTPYVYNPTSKYQEEVAIRNAYLPYKSRPSSEAGRKSFDHERSASMTNRSVRSVASAQQNGNYSHHAPSDSTGSNAKNLNDLAPHHVRTLSSRSRELPPLAITPKAQPDEDRGGGLNITTQAPYSPTRSIGPHNTREARMSTIQEGLPYDIRPISMTRTVGLRDSSHSSVNAYPDYRLSSTDYGSRPVSTRSAFTDRLYELQQGEALYGPPSTYSVASSTKRATLANRTIMDLTNDDSEIFSEASSAFGYSQYSPVVEQAKSDAFRRVEPSQIHTEERRGSKGAAQSLEPIMMATRTVVQPDVQYRPRPVFDEYEPEPEPEYEVQAQPALSTGELESEKRLPSPSAFSPISTVASWSPRSSAYIPPTSEAVSMTARVIAALEASRAIAKTPPQSLVPKRETSELVKERVATFESNSESSTPPPTSAVEKSINNLQRKESPPVQTPQPQSYPVEYDTPKTTVVESLPVDETEELTPRAIPIKEEKMVSAEAPVVIEAKPVTVEPVEEPVVETPAAKGKGKAPVTPQVYMSPESITSVDYTNPGDTFGVRTRDFAVSPRQDTSPLAVKQNPSPAVVRTPVRAAALPTVTPAKSGSKKARKARTPKSTTAAAVKPAEPAFDEEAFARKRAEARAALDKLQKSLSEDFLTLPDRATIKGKQRSVESQPVTPTPVLILPSEAKNTEAGIESRPRPESMEKPPPSSFRSSREMQPRSSRDMQQRSSREMSQRSSREMQQRTSREMSQRSSREVQQRSSLVSNRSLSTGSRSSRKGPAPSSLRNVEPAINPIDQSILSPALLQAMTISSKPPKSPGEVSLSSFPVPSSSRPPSQPDAPPGFHSQNNSITSVMKRRSSTKSQGSTTSAYSIPLHMIPGRTSSVRDPVPEEIDTWG